MSTRHRYKRHKKDRFRWRVFKRTTPMWWNHEASVVPSRRKDNQNIKKILNGYLNYEEDISWGDYKKPQEYYW